MHARRSGETLVIGYGNELRRDDGAGRRLAEIVESRGLPGVHVVSLHQLGPELAKDIAEARMVIFADAVPPESTDGGEPQVVRLHPSGFDTALGHAPDPSMLLLLARALYSRCPKACLIRIPATSFEFGIGLSERTEEAVEEAAHIVEQLVGWTPRSVHGHSPEDVRTKAMEPREPAAVSA